LWHTATDNEFALQLVGELRSRGLAVISMGEIKEREEPSFTIDWQMSQSDCGIFLISESALTSPLLQTDAEKMMRRKGTLLIPAYLEHINSDALPLLLQYIQPVEFYLDYPKAIDTLIAEIELKIQGTPSVLSKAIHPWARPFRWVIEHFRRYLTLSPLTFCWQITVENLIVSLAVTGLIYLIWQPAPRTNLQNLTAINYFWSIIIIGPIVETVMLQAIPVLIARVLGLKFFGQLLFSILPFAILHFTRSIGAGIGAGLIGGFYSAFTFIHWQSKSTWQAFWVTAFSHCLYNLALFAMLIGEF
jgi:hypothetical protein